MRKQIMNNKLSELNTKLPINEPTIEEKIVYMQEALDSIERARLIRIKAHQRIERERNANK